MMHNGVDSEGARLFSTERLDESSDAQPLHPAKAPPPPPPAFLLSNLLHRLSISSQRILLSGPSKSGRSSLLLNLACHLAAMTPCHSAFCGRQHQPCTCSAVIFFQFHANGNDDSSDFPLECHQAMSQEENGTKPSPLESTSQPWSRTSATTSFTTAAMRPLLKRIQVVHVHSARDVYTHLLMLDSVGVGGILVDDLDRITARSVRGLSSGRDAAATHALAMSQLLAVLVDTANFLQSQADSARPPLIVATTESPSLSSNHQLSATTAPSIFSFCGNLNAQWLEIIPGDLSLWQSKHIVAEDEAVVSSWTLRGYTGQDSSDTAKQLNRQEAERTAWCTIGHHAIIKTLQDCHILWKTTQQAK